MLKAIFNGYYRSGTTLIFKLLEKSNPSDICLYEPLHPWLKNNIENKKSSILLHEEYLYSSYLKLSNVQKYLLLHDKIMKNKKKEEDFIPFDIRNVKKILDFLNSESTNIILQTNRMHFILKDVKNFYKIPVIHIIRNPIDVYFSSILSNSDRRHFLFNFMYKHRTNRLMKEILLKLIPKTSYVKGRFFVEDDFKLINKFFNLGYSEKIDFLSKILVVWTYVNYYVMKNIGKENIVYYEDFIKNPNELSKKIEKMTGCKLDIKKIKIKKNQISINNNLVNFFYKKFEELGLLKKVKIIFNFDKYMNNTSESFGLESDKYE